MVKTRKSSSSMLFLNTSKRLGGQTAIRCFIVLCLRITTTASLFHHYLLLRPRNSNMTCIHPQKLTYVQIHGEYRFAKVMTSAGIEPWTLVQHFSRVLAHGTYSNDLLCVLYVSKGVMDYCKVIDYCIGVGEDRILASDSLVLVFQLLEILVSTCPCEKRPATDCSTCIISIFKMAAPAEIKPLYLFRYILFSVG